MISTTMRTTLLAACTLAACKSDGHRTEAPAPPGSAAPAPGSAAPSSNAAPATSVALPGGEHGIGFDDLRFSAHLGRVIAPGGGTGQLALIDPTTHEATYIAGFGTASGTTGHEDGTTSADEGNAHLYAIDRTKQAVTVIDEKSHTILDTTALASSPDYVRYVDATHELWVTEPDADRIEVFVLEHTKPVHAGFIAVKGGPESLVIDGARAYTHLWDGATVVVDTKTRKLLATWPNGCKGSRGIALDTAHHHLFVGCAEGKAVTLDSESGKLLGSVDVGAGVDIIDFNPRLSHLYVPSGNTAALSIVGVAPSGALSLLGTMPAAPGTHCVAADDRDVAWVCDPGRGRLLAIADSFPATR